MDLGAVAQWCLHSICKAVGSNTSTVKRLMKKGEGGKRRRKEKGEEEREGKGEGREEEKQNKTKEQTGYGAPHPKFQIQ